METFEVTVIEQRLIKGLFGGFVFRRTENGKHYIKVSIGQKKSIAKYLFMNLTNPTQS